jgi:hypothetical protein
MLGFDQPTIGSGAAGCGLLKGKKHLHDHSMMGEWKLLPKEQPKKL